MGKSHNKKAYGKMEISTQERTGMGYVPVTRSLRVFPYVRA